MSTVFCKLTDCLQLDNSLFPDRRQSTICSFSDGSLEASYQQTVNAQESSWERSGDGQSTAPSPDRATARKPSSVPPPPAGRRQHRGVSASKCCRVGRGGGSCVFCSVTCSGGASAARSKAARVAWRSTSTSSAAARCHTSGKGPSTSAWIPRVAGGARLSRCRG